MKRLSLLASLIVIASMILSACGAPATAVPAEATQAPEAQPTAAPEQPTIAPEQPTSEPVQATEAMPPEKKSLTMVHPEEIRWLDPAQMTEGQSGIMARNIYSRLLDQSYDGTVFTPDLAESWEVSADGLTYTFNLRKDVKFHDGTPMTSADVVYSYQRALNIGQGDSVFLIGILDPENVVAKDDYTVEMTLNKPWAPFLNIVASPRVLSILPKAWVEANKTAEDPWAKEYLFDHANGTGPYKFITWVPKQHIELEKYADYYQGPAKVDTIIYQLNSEDIATRLMLEKGEVDIVQKLPDDMMKELAKNPDVVVMTKPLDSFMYWIFKCNEKPFDDKRVRQAVAYAIDYDAIMSGLVMDGGIRMTTPLLKGMLGYNEDIPPIQRDVEKAKALMAEAGYKDGFKIEMPYVQWGLIPLLAVAIQANLGEIGIEAELKEIPLNSLVAGIETGEFNFFVWNSNPAYPHPDALFFKLLSTSIGKGADGNIAYYTNLDVDKTIDNAVNSTDVDEQIANYEEAQVLIMEDMPWLLLYQESNSHATRSTVTGYDFGSFNHTNFYLLDTTK